MPESRLSSVSRWADAFGQAWNRFWFTPASPFPCAVLRILIGLIVVAHLLTLSGDLDRWFSRDAMLSQANIRALINANVDDPFFHYSYFSVLTPTEAAIAHWAAIAVALLFTLGALTRVTGAVTLIALLAYIHRMPIVVAHAESVLVFLLAYLVIAPSGALFSIDAWLAARRGRPAGKQPDEPSVAAGIALRMIQVHLAAFIAMMGMSKFYGDAWWDGIAIWHLLAQTHSRPLDLTFLRRNEYLLNFWTHAVAYFELAFPVLVWPRLTRPIMLALAIVIWLSIIISSGLLSFGLLMIAASLAYWPPSTLRAVFGYAPATQPA